VTRVLSFKDKKDATVKITAAAGPKFYIIFLRLLFCPQLQLSGPRPISKIFKNSYWLRISSLDAEFDWFRNQLKTWQLLIGKTALILTSFYIFLNHSRVLINMFLMFHIPETKQILSFMGQKRTFRISSLDDS